MVSSVPGLSAMRFQSLRTRLALSFGSLSERGASFPELDVGCKYYAAASTARRYHLEQLPRDLDVEWHVAELVEYD